MIAASYRISSLKPLVHPGTGDGHSPQTEEVCPLLRWWDAYPVAKSSVPEISIQELATLLQDATMRDYVVIDVRRNDHGVGYTCSHLILCSCENVRVAMSVVVFNAQRKASMTTFLPFLRSLVTLRW
jgi:hypothetical protein